MDLVRKQKRWPRSGAFRYFAQQDQREWSDEVAAMRGYAPGTVDPTTELVRSQNIPTTSPASRS